ncbi:MAG: Lrp/AsnC family transcriptional regulator [Hyphomonadaceae bacterium]|nr:Lrp/AsnC family transcriptional regulator [Hyphomonadaceae bacterium]
MSRNGSDSDATGRRARGERSRSRRLSFSPLDGTDLDILRRIEMDARLTNQALSEHVALSAGACLSRVRRLESEGVILCYRTEIEATEIAAWVYVFGEIVLTGEGRKVRANVEGAFRDDPFVLEAHQAAGRADYLLVVAGPDVSAWPKFIERIDPEGRLIAASDAIVRVRQVKRFSGLPQLKQP